MTLIETLTSAVIHGFCRFVPVSAEAHQWLFQKFLGFPALTEGWIASFSLGALGSLLIYFIHDWASIFSSAVQVLVYRKRPMTLDERLPFFMVFCAAPPLISVWLLASRFQRHSLLQLQELSAPLLLPALVAGSLLLVAASRWSRRNRGPFDLNLLDSVLMGIGQTFSWLPGVGGTLGILATSQFRNYHLETATKNASLLSLPFLTAEVFQGLSSISWHGAEPLPGTSWFQWTLAVLIAAVTSFVGLRVLNELIRSSGFGKIVTYRMMLSAGILAALLFR